MAGPHHTLEPQGHSEIQNPEDLPPYLLKSLPRWYPGGWAPPALMLTLASICVFFAALLYLIADPLKWNLFRFPVPESLPPALHDYYLLVPTVATALAWTVVYLCRSRPGPNLPRYWCLALALFCSALVGWALADRFALDNLRGDPKIHIASAAAFMAVLTLLPRLKRVLPYQSMVHWIGPVSLLVTLVLTLGVARRVGDTIVRTERERVSKADETLNRIVDDLRRGLLLDASAQPGALWSDAVQRRPSSLRTRLEQLEKHAIALHLPDKYVWHAAQVLGKEADLREACRRLADTVVSALDEGARPELRTPQYQLTRNGWEPVRQFDEASSVTARYYRNARRLMEELRGLQGSPAADHFESARLRYQERVNQMNARADQHWLAAISSLEKIPSPPEMATALEMTLGANNIPLGKIDEWKMLPYQASVTNPPAACARAPGWHTTETRWFTDNSVDPPQKKPVTYYQWWERVDCYSYVPNEEATGARMLAQVHLTYNTTPSQTQIRRISGGALPFEVAVYFEAPRGQRLSEFRDRVLNGVAGFFGGVPRGLRDETFAATGGSTGVTLRIR